MLHYLAGEFVNEFGALNVFSYITTRTGLAAGTAGLIVFLFGPWMISSLKIRQGRGQPIRDDGPISHIVGKQGTPTMGGLMILFGVCVAVLLWGSLDNIFVWLVLFVTLSFGLIGFYDDYLKVTKSTTRGFPGSVRLTLEFVVAGIAVAGFMWFTAEPLSGALAFPVLKDFLIHLGWFFLPFGAFVIVGSANAVNLTDGLDGLAIGPVMIAVFSFAGIAYLVGNSVFAEHLQIHFVQRSGELAVVCGAILGAGLGFLWFNAPPAMIFMGDTGSLSLGGALGAIAVATKHELVLAIIGGLFVLEAVSVIVQVFSYKLTGKRVFRMAPLHHHFEQKGWKEPTIVIRFWIIAIVLALIGLSTLKLR